MAPRRKSRKSQKGGGLGGTVEFDPKGHELTNNPIAWSVGSSCMEAARPFVDAPKGTGGLPGMSGGRRRKSRQSGGRYGMGEFNGVGMGPPWGSGIPPTINVPCEAGRSAIPLPEPTLNKVGGPLWSGPTPNQLGGATTILSPMSLGSPSLTEQTAGYTHLRDIHDTINTSAGTMEMINVPLAGRIMNPACLQTGGKNRKSRKSRNRKSRNRKSRNRKSRNRKSRN